uniref:Uncharacterized protein n=1 Tax=Ditylenchus dipsaci TaxID=166011 RepID=A0A915DI99_9BILA
MCNCELKRVNRQFEEEISELKQKNEEFTTKKQQKKKELQSELEGLRKEKKEESKKAAKQIQDLNNSLDEKLKEIGEKTDQIRQLNGEVRMFKADLDKLQAKSMLDEQKLETLTAELETAMENFARSHAEAALLREQGEASDKRLKDERISWQITQQSLESELEALQNNAVSQADLLTGQLKDLEQKNKVSSEETRSLQTDLETAKQAQKQLAEQLQSTIQSMQQQKQDMLAEHERLSKELKEAHALSQSLRAQIRPIGSQLERRYEEERYRLSEALKKITDLENSLATSSQTIADLQLELEQQFNSQMDMISALKKKFIVLKGGSISNTTQCQSSVDSIGWTSNSSEGTNSVDEEEEEHSEGEENRTAVITTKQSS